MGWINVAWLNGNDFNSWKDATDDALVQVLPGCKVRKFGFAVAGTEGLCISCR